MRISKLVVLCTFTLFAALAVLSTVVVRTPGTPALAGPVIVQGHVFTDVDDLGREARLAITCIFEAGITRGTSATEYSPSQPVTRLQMALFLSRLLDEIELSHSSAPDPGFIDLQGLDSEMRSAIARTFALSITRSTSATEYSPHDPLTRHEMALFLVGLFNAAGVAPSSGFVPGFDDTASLDTESRAAVANLRVHGVTQGRSAREYAPAATVTRAEMALFLSRALAVIAATRAFDPPSGCNGAIRAHNAVARPSTLKVAVEPDSPHLGQPVTVQVTLTDPSGRAAPDLEVRLVRDGQAISPHVATRPDGTVAFELEPAPPSSPASSVEFEVRVANAVLTSSATAITWSRLDLTGITPAVAVHVGDASPTVGDDVDVVATVTDEDGAPLFGAELEFVIDGESRGMAVADADGQATFTFDAPIGPSNQGGYDSIQVQVVSTDVATRPVGVFWQARESRRITLSVSPDTPHTDAARTITAEARDGSAPLSGQAVELRIDGTLAGRATTDSRGLAEFTRTAPVHGPFDLARAVLVGDRSITSNGILFSWPMRTRGANRGNGWELVWSDEFDGTSLDTSKWTAANNCPPVYLACDTDRPENVYVSDGMLHLRSLREPYVGANTWSSSGNQFGPLTSYTPGELQFKDFTAGRVDSAVNFTYGRFEMLGKLPQGHGTFFAYWMRPRNSPYGNDAAGGEIDIAEGANIGRGGNPRGQIDAQLPGPGWGVHHVVHMGYPFNNPYALTNLPVNPAESFHLYAIEWDTASIRFYVDDERVLTVPQSDWFSQPRDSDEPVDNPYAPFDVPFSIVINNTIGNWALETWPGHQVPDTTVFPAKFVADYVRVYECRPPSGAGGRGPGQGCETP